MKIKRKSRIEIISNIVLLILSISCIVPFILLIVSSFTDDTSITMYGYSFFPRKLSLDAYKYLFAQASVIGRAYGITIFITAVGTTISLVITSMLAYPLSRKDYPFRNVQTFLVFFTMLFNGGLVPTYLVYSRMLGLKNTIFALIIPALLMNGFNVLLMRTFFSTNIPPAIIESAKIDGAGEFGIFIKIIVPLSLPILATIGLLVGVGYWNDWNNGLIYITNSKLFSIQNLLNRILQDVQFLASDADASTQSGDAMNKLPTTTVRMAIAVIGVIPILVIYPFFQKYFQKGITIGAVKG